MSSLSVDTAPASGPARGRASWSGLLRLSLVAVPVKAYPAVATSEAIHLHQLHRACGQRIRYQKHCPLHGQVEADQIVKGCEYAPDQYALVEPEELENIRPEKDKALTLEQFIDPDQFDPSRLSGRTMYLLPDGPAAHRPYRVLAQTCAERGRWGLGRVVMSGHRYGVVVRPTAQLLSLHFLHEPDQVRASATFASQLRADTSSPEELRLAAMLIDAATGPVDWNTYRDDTAVQLERIVEAKIAGRAVTTAKPDEPVPVIELLAALKASVAATQPPPQSGAQRASRRRSA
jgi:DNA end-binding protein Ku